MNKSLIEALQSLGAAITIFTLSVSSVSPVIAIAEDEPIVVVESREAARMEPSHVETPSEPDRLTSTEIREVTPIEEVVVLERAGSGRVSTYSARVDESMYPIFVPQPQTSTIAGRVYEDSNTNGALDSIDPLLHGWVIQLFDREGNLVKAARTDIGGSYAFEELADGAYSVQVVLKDIGYALSAPANGVYNLSLAHEINRGINFGIKKIATISGFVWFDANNNGLWDLGELPLENRGIRATHNLITPSVSTTPGGTIGMGGGSASISGHGASALPSEPVDMDNLPNQLVKRTTTNAQGFYKFAFNISELGDWNVHEIVPDEWVTTYPDPAIHSVTIDSPLTQITDQNFGNLHLYEVLGMLLAPYSGDPTTTEITEVFSGNTIVLPSGSVVTIPTGTKLTSGNGAYSIFNLVAEDFSSGSVSGLGSNVDLAAAIRFGAPGTDMNLDMPTGVSIMVNGALEGETLNIQRSLDGATDWNTDGITSPATCEIMGGSCTFAITKTGVFAVTGASQDPGGDDPAPSGGGGGGGGGDPGGGGPIVPFVPPPGTGGTGGTGSTGGTTGGEQTPTLLVLNGVEGNTGGGTTGTGGTGGAGAGGAEATLTGEDVVNGLGLQNGQGAEAAEETPENPSFLANIGSLLTFGTGNWWLGLLSILIILALIWYAYKSFFSDERQNKKA